MPKKIHSRDAFESCYLRHQYLKKANINPTKEEVAPYNQIIKGQSGKTYSKYKELFYAVGFEFVDIIRISSAHLISYLGLFNIEKDPKKFAKFEESFCLKNSISPAQNDILDKNKADFTSFLKQRMEELVRICRQKVRNIRGVPMQEFHIFSSPFPPAHTNEDVIKNFRDLGYRKVDAAIFRAIKKKANPSNALCFNFNNLWYASIPTNYRPLQLLDFSNSDLDPRDNLHNMNPEDLLSFAETTKKNRIEKNKFKRITSDSKKDMLRSFIGSNKDNSVFEEELQTAQKILDRLES